MILFAEKYVRKIITIFLTNVNRIAINSLLAENVLVMFHDVD